MCLLENGKEVVAVLEDHGYEAYLVGGCVRDYIINRTIQDVDICTSALPEQVMALFKRSIPTGLKHGTVTVLWGDRDIPFEITTFRTEKSYHNYRYPTSVSFVTSLNKDMERRDFTINALAMDKEGQIYDFFNGREAIERQEIKTVGNPFDRFSEDALRMLRAIRFSSQLGFTIGGEVMQAIQHMNLKLDHISIERITSEFEKIMASSYPEKGISSLMEGNIITNISPFHLIEDSFHRLKEFQIRELSDIERWAFLFSLHEKTESKVTEFLQALTLRNSFTKKVRKLYEAICNYKHVSDVNQFSKPDLFRLGLEQCRSILRINHVKMLKKNDKNRLKNTNNTESNLMKQKKCTEQELMKNTKGIELLGQLEKLEAAYDSLLLKKPQDLDVTGKELIQLVNKKPGPWIEKSLQILIEAVLLEKVANRKEALLFYLDKQLQMECE